MSFERLVQVRTRQYLGLDQNDGHKGPSPCAAVQAVRILCGGDPAEAEYAARQFSRKLVDALRTAPGGPYSGKTDDEIAGVLLARMDTILAAEDSCRKAP